MLPKPLKALLQWAVEQFRLLGKGDASPKLALHLITALQGASLVSNAFNDPSVIAQETDQLKVWLNEVVPSATRTRPQKCVSPHGVLSAKHKIQEET